MRELERCEHGALDGVRCRPCEETPEVVGGDYVVSLTSSVQLRVPDVEALATRMNTTVDDALTQRAVGAYLGRWVPGVGDLVEVVSVELVNTEVVPADERPTDRALRQLRAKLAELPQ